MKAFQYLAALGIGAVVTLGETPLSAQPAPESTAADGANWDDRARAMGAVATTLVPQVNPVPSAAQALSWGEILPPSEASQPEIAIPVLHALSGALQEAVTSPVEEEVLIPTETAAIAVDERSEVALGATQPGLQPPMPLSGPLRTALAGTMLSLGNPVGSLEFETTPTQVPAPSDPVSREIAQTEAAQTEIAQDEIAQDEIAQTEAAQDEIAQDEIAQTEAAQAEAAQNGEAVVAPEPAPGRAPMPVDNSTPDAIEQEFVQEGAPPSTDLEEEASPGSSVPTQAGTQTDPAMATDLIDRQPNLLRPSSTDEVSITANEAISLEEAIEVARQNNPTITIRQLQLDQSQAAVDEAKAAYAPSFSVNGNFDQSGTLSETSELYREPEQTLFQNSGDSNSRSAVVSLDGNAQMTYNIIDPDRKARIRAAEIAAQQAEFSLEQELADLRLDVSQAYYALQEADEQVTISEQAVRSAQSSLDDAIALRDAGVGTQFSVLQSQVQLANEQQNLVNGLSAQQKARRQLAQVLSVPEKLNLTAADPVQRGGNWESTLEESIIRAYANRIELDNQLLQRELSDAQREIVLSATRPSLSAFAQAGPSLGFNFNRTEREDDDVTKSGTRQGSLGYQVGLRFQWLFSDGGATQAAARQQELNQAIASENFELARDSLRREVEDAFYDLAANLRNIDTAEQGVTQADEALRLARLRFQAGVGTQSEIIDAERDLTTARGNRVTAILNYNRALVQMQRAVGESLPAPDYSSPDYAPAGDAS